MIFSDEVIFSRDFVVHVRYTILFQTGRSGCCLEVALMSIIVEAKGDSVVMAMFMMKTTNFHIA